MKCEPDQLQAYLDDALAVDAKTAVEQHLSGCGDCQAEMDVLRERREEITMRLAALDPRSHEVPPAAEALVRFRRLVKPETTPESRTARERFEMLKQSLLTGRWRPAAVGVMALVILIALFSFAPARQAAAQFLGIFRVRKFAVIPVDPAQLERLESLDNLADSGLMGEPTMLREPGDEQTVTDAAEASRVAGFTVRVPTALPETAHLSAFTAATGPAMRFEVEPGMMELVLQAAGLDDVQLPSVDTIPVEVDLPAMVQQTYLISGRKMTFVQMPSPTATLPPGVDPAMLGEILLRLLGMPAEEAGRVARSIDWTSTLVVPLPTNVGSFHEVEIDGVTGLLLEEKREYQSYQRLHRMVLWQRDGIIYSMEGAIDATEMLRLADSLR